MTLLDVCTWLEQSQVATYIRESEILFPVIESMHLVGLGLLGGMVLVVDLRLCGIGLVSREVGELDAHTRPWFWSALIALMASGALLFVSEAVKCYYSGPFWIKMASLGAVVLLVVTVRARVIRLGYARSKPALTRGIGMLSMLLWFLVAWGGRWIGFSG